MDSIAHCIQAIEASGETRQRVEAIQSSMVKDCSGCFSDKELDSLRVVIRLTIEFNHYLQLSCAHRFCLEYECESIRSGVDFFCTLTRAYRVLVGATESTIKWDAVAPSFREKFASMFDEFDRQTNFENKCRLLLDLFKLQIIFAGVSFD
jgi:hypothetical protein